MTKLFIPRTVTKIDGRFTSGCTKLDSLIIDPENPKYDSRENCNGIIETASNKYINALDNGQSFIPNTVDSIGVNAFSSGRNYKRIVIPNSVKYLGGSSFNYLPDLEEIIIGDSVVYIDGAAISSCNKLTDLTLGKSVQFIGNNGFSWNDNLLTVTLQDSVKSIGSYCLASSDKLISFTCKALIPPTLGEAAFHPNALANATLYVPMKTIEDYRVADGWKDFVHIEGIYLPVDANNDGKFSIADISSLIDILLSGNSIDDPSLDMNCDGRVTIADVSAMINYLLSD